MTLLQLIAALESKHLFQYVMLNPDEYKEILKHLNILAKQQAIAENMERMKKISNQLIHY